MTKRICIGTICSMLLTLLYLGGPAPQSADAYMRSSILLEEGGGGGGGGGSSSLSGAAVGQPDPGWLPFANVTTTLPAIDLSLLRPTDTVRPLRIAVISSGVVPGVFPTALQSRFVRQLGNLDDSLGYGTYASSAILQLHPDAEITSLGIYPGGRLDTTYLKESLKWAVGWASTLDAVLLAFPPSDFLDPMSLSLTPGQDGKLIDAISDSPIPGPDGPVYGIATDETLFATQGTSGHGRATLAHYRQAFKVWDEVETLVRQIVSKNVGVVIPAGDLGPNPQTILGLANLPEVLTVGGFSTQTAAAPAKVSSNSSAGPSVELKVKPDLLAPSGIVGLAPAASSLGAYLRARGLADSSLPLQWANGAVGTVSSDRALADTTFSPAVVAAVQMAMLRAQALGDNIDLDVAHQKGGLYAKTQPLPGVPPWKQGRGALGGTDLSLGMPTLQTTQSPLSFTHFDLGLEPGQGPWSSKVSTTTQTSGYAVDITDFIGVDLEAKALIATTTSTAAPQVTVTVGANGVTVTATVGNDDKEAGLYCGYVRLDFSDRSERVPICLMNGITPVARSFAIHDRSASDMTYGLATALPVGASLLDHPLHMLPLNPIGHSLFMKITEGVPCIRYGGEASTCKGHGRFTVVPPGYYQVRVWSDYGAPVEYGVETKSPVTGLWTTSNIEADLGNPLGYTGYKTLLLPRAKDTKRSTTTTAVMCDETYGPWDDWSGHKASEATITALPDLWKHCSQTTLTEELSKRGRPDPIYDDSSGGFLVETAVAKA